MVRTYIVTRKADGVEVFRYQVDADHVTAPLEWPGLEFATHEHTLEPLPATSPVNTAVFGGRRRVTKLEFVALMGQDAYVAILAMAKQSVVVEAWVKMLDLATPESDGTSINLDDPRTAVGIQSIGAALEHVGAVQPGWAQGVLNG